VEKENKKNEQLKNRCPYPDCKSVLVKAAVRYCPECNRKVRRCLACGSFNLPDSSDCFLCNAYLGEDPGDWLMFKGNPARTGNTPEKLRTPLKIKWTYPEKSLKERIFTSPIVYQGMVFFGSCDRHLHAVDQFNGKSIWKRPTGDKIISTPAIYRGVIFVASLDGNIYAQLTKNGKPLWVFSTEESSGKITAPLLACAQGVIAVTADGALYCIDSETGKKKWVTVLETTAGEAEYSSGGGAAFQQGMIFIGTNRGIFYAIEASSGKISWRVTGKKEDNPPFIATPAVVAKTCYTPDRSGNFYAFSLENGKDTWSHTVSLDGVVEGSPSVGFGKILVGTQSQYIAALNLHTGGEIWRKKNERIRLMDAVLSTPLITSDGLVFYGSNSGYIYCRLLESGEEVWKHKLDSPVTCCPAASCGFLYVTSTAGFLYAFIQEEYF